MHGELLADIGKCIIAAGVVGLPAYFMRIPLILAYVIAGVAIGPHFGLSLIKDSASISSISEIGLVLLLFILGLEINLKKLLQTGRAVIQSGIVQIVGSFALSSTLFFFLGYSSSNYDLIYLAVACSLSSTLIVVKILSDQMELDSLPSRITLGILVLQDLFAIGFLAIQPSLSDLNALALFSSLAKVAGLVFFCWLMAKYILPTIFKKAGRHPELMLILALAWCFAICGLANLFHLSIEMGALVAGISIASFPYHLDVAAKISSLRDFFITLFFVSLGLQIPMPTAHVLTLTFAVTGFVLLSRILTIYPVLHAMGYANRASLLPAINLSQLSEFSLVLATLGVAQNHISPDLLSAFVLSMVFTALLSAFVIPNSHNWYLHLNKWLELIGFNDHVSKNIANEQTEQILIKPKIVLLGFYREASSLLLELQKKYTDEINNQILVVDFNPEAHNELKKLNIHCKYGDISNVDTLRHLDLASAEVIICSIPDKILKGTTNQKLLHHLKGLAPKSSIIVSAENLATARLLYKEGASYVCLPRVVTATYLVDIIERLQVDGPDSIKESASVFLQSRKEIIP